MCPFLFYPTILTNELFLSFNLSFELNIILNFYIPSEYTDLSKTTD